jgi:Nif-specific regulatory protein
MANKGSIFLDEIGSVGLTVQIKLLRALQEKEFERVGGHQTIKTDVLIIAATNKNLERAVEDESFRGDLYYRLNVFPIYMPPLRERKTDILLLADHFLEKYAAEKQQPADLSAGCQG